MANFGAAHEAAAALLAIVSVVQLDAVCDRPLLRSFPMEFRRFVNWNVVYK